MKKHTAPRRKAAPKAGTKVRVKAVEGVNPKYHGIMGRIVEDDGNFDGWAKFRVTSIGEIGTTYPLAVVLKRAALAVVLKRAALEVL